MLLTMNQIEPMLHISKNLLDDELEKQSQVMYSISEAVAEHYTDYMRVKDALEVCEAGLYVDIKRDTAKITADEVKSTIQIDPERRALFARVCTEQRLHQKWLGLLEAWKQRGFALKSLADLAVANYYTVDTTYADNRKLVGDSIAKRPVMRRRES